jgi:hypothetical protein
MNHRGVGNHRKNIDAMNTRKNPILHKEQTKTKRNHGLIVILELVSLSEHMRFPYVLMGLYCSLFQLVVPCVCHCLLYFLVHRSVCSSKTYGLWLPLWYLQSRLRTTVSDYLFGIFKLCFQMQYQSIQWFYCHWGTELIIFQEFTPAISVVSVAHSLPEFTPAISSVPVAHSLSEFTPAINAVPVVNYLPEFTPTISSAPVAHPFRSSPLLLVQFLLLLPFRSSPLLLVQFLLLIPFRSSPLQ